MAYTLFSKNLVDYAGKYRGMQSVVIAGLEAFADVRLSDKEDGAKWTVPPYFIDSVAHLADFITNCSDDMDTASYYCVTPVWGSMRFVGPLVPGGRYRSYVKMIPTKEDPQVYQGDVYVLRADDNTVIGMVGAITFRRFPRVLLNRFFTAPQVSDEEVTTSSGTSTPKSRPATKPATQPATQRMKTAAAAATSQDEDTRKPDAACEKPSEQDNKTTKSSPLKTEHSSASSSDGENSASSTTSKDTQASSVDGEAAKQSGGMTDKALSLLARETAIDRSELRDGADFASLRVDSLISLVLAEKFTSELGIKVNGSLFLDYPTVGDMREWLDEYY